MKKLSTILAMAAGMVAVASCQKENVAVENTGAASYAFPTREVVFKANLTKTTLNGTTPSWEAGDSVQVLWVEHLAAVLEDGTGNELLPERDSVCKALAKVDPATGTFTASVGTPKDFFYAVYPHFASTDILLGQNQDANSLDVGIRYESMLDGTFKTAHYAAAVTDETALEFNFKNITNVFKFSVTNPDVTGVVISTNDKSPITGHQAICFNQSGELDETPALSATSPKTTVTVSGAGTYYVPVLYGQKWMGGITFAEFKDADLVSFTVAEKPILATRAEVHDFGALEDHKVTKHDWYFKQNESGSGSGEDWDNAAGVSKLKELLSSSTGYLYIDKTNLHVAEGTYDMAVTDEQGGKNSLGLTFPTVTGFTLLGGYPADAAGTDVSGRDVKTHKTVFTTTANCSNARMFYAYDGCVLGNLVFDGLTFAGTVLKNVRGWVIYINDVCKFPNDDSRVTFNNCLFDGVKCTAADNSYYGLIDLNNPDGRVSVTGCEFKDNVSDNKNGAAALYVEQAKEFTVSNCTFSGNKATNTSTYGGTVLLKGGKTSITDCTFTSNTSAGLGGAIGIGISTSEVEYALPDVVVSKCTFTSNSGAKGGAIAQANGNLLVQDCIFNLNQATLNSSNYGGGVFNNDVGVGNNLGSSKKGVGNATFLNCTMTGNSSTGRGGAIAHAAQGHLKIYGGSISGSYNSTKSNGGGAIFFGNSITTGQGPLYIDGVAFSGNKCQQNKSNGSGAAIMTKNGGEMYINNCSFTGHETAASGSGVIHTTNSNAFLGIYNCTFADNSTSTSVINVDKFPTVIANCSFAEATAYNNGIIFSTGSSTTKAVANIVVGADATSNSFGNVGIIASGYNVYSALKGVSLFPVADASDYSSQTISGVFGSSPAINKDGKLVPSTQISTLGTQITGTTLKNTISGASQAFYDWLVERNAFAGRPADTQAWTSGSYQQ